MTTPVSLDQFRDCLVLVFWCSFAVGVLVGCFGLHALMVIYDFRSSMRKPRKPRKPRTPKVEPPRTGELFASDGGAP